MLGTEITPHKLSKLIKIAAKRQLIQCIKIKEIYIYIAEQNELLWKILERRCCNNAEERIPNSILIVNSIKRSRTSCKFD